MNALFIGVGGALILALFTALVGPHFVDWTAQRAWVEREASSVLGVPVGVAGGIDLRLLPAPVIHLENVSIGTSKGARAASAPELKVGRVTLNLSLTAFLRGEVRADEVQVERAALDIAVDEEGAVALPVTVPLDARADRTILERIVVSGSRIRLIDARTGTTTLLDNVRFDGEARSLAGPYKAGGSYRWNGIDHAFRLATSRVENGLLRLKASVAPADRPLSVEFDGSATIGPRPGLEGRVIATRAPVEGDEDARPWRFDARVKADAAEAVLERLELGYGAEDRRAVLTGNARRTFGRDPSLQTALSARQIDLDRLFGTGEASTLAAKVGRLLESAPALANPPEKVTAQLDVGGVVLGGGVISNIRLDLAGRRNGWTIRSAEAVLPGSSPFRFAGDLALGPGEERLEGTGSIESSTFSALRNWLGGFGEVGEFAVAPGRLEARTRLTLARDTLVLDDLSLALGEASVSGRVALAPAPGRSGRRLDVALRAARLDLDRLLPPESRRRGFGLLDLPSGVSDASVALDAEALTFEGVRSEGVSAKLRISDEVLTIERLSVVRLGGASLDVAGQLRGGVEAPEGRLTVAAKADDLGGLARILSAADATRVYGEALERRRAALAPLDLNASFDFSRGQDGIGGRIALGGTAGGSRISADVALQDLAPGGGRTDAKLLLDNPSASRLLGQLGFAVPLGEGLGAGTLSLAASGPLRGDIQVEGRIEGVASSLGVRGLVRPFAEPGGRSRLGLQAESRDLGLLAPVLGVDAALAGGDLPLTLVAQLSGAGDAWTLHDLSAELAGARLSGRLDLVLGDRPKIDGEAITSDLDLEALLALGLGGDLRSDAGAVWSDAPFAAPLLEGVEGELRLTADRAAFLPGATLGNVRARLVLTERGAALRDLEAELGQGRLSGVLEIGATDGAQRLALRAKLAGARLEDFGWREPGGLLAKGVLDLSLEMQAEGRSPLALLSQGVGGGTIAVDGAEIRGLDPQVFATVVRAVDAGLALDEPKIREAVTARLAKGAFIVPRAEAAISIEGGLLRVSNFALEGEAATVLGSARLDLARLALDADTTFALRRPVEEGGAPPPPLRLAFRGPVDAPARQVDVGSVLDFLTARALDQELKRLDELEAEITERERLSRELTRLAQERRQRQREAEEARRRIEEEARRVAEEARRKAEEEARRLAEEKRRRDDEQARLEAERLLSTPPPEGTASLPRPFAPGASGDPTRLVPPEAPRAPASRATTGMPAPQRFLLPTPQRPRVPPADRPLGAPTDQRGEAPLVDRFGESVQRP